MNEPSPDTPIARRKRPVRAPHVDASGVEDAGRPLCLGISAEWGAMERTTELLAETGWNGWFAVWHPGDDLRPLAARGASLGLATESVHAPWGRAADLWGSDESKGEAAVAELLACLRAAAEIGAPFVVAHAWIGFTPTAPTEDGIRRFARVADEAEGSAFRSPSRTQRARSTSTRCSHASPGTPPSASAGTRATSSATIAGAT